MKKLLFISVLLVAFACSKEDEASEQTFLEKYDGFAFEGITIMGSGSNGRTQAYFFYNSEVFFKEYRSWLITDPTSVAYGKLIEDCREAIEGIDEGAHFSYGSDEIKIIENNSTTLKVKIGRNTKKFTVDASGETLTYEFTNENNILVYDLTNQFIKSDAKYSDYCN